MPSFTNESIAAAVQQCFKDALDGELVTYMGVPLKYENYLTVQPGGFISDNVIDSQPPATITRHNVVDAIAACDIKEGDLVFIDSFGKAHVLKEPQQG